MPNDEKHFAIVTDEVHRHLEDTESSKLAHWYAARIYERVHRFYLGMPATVMSIVLAWLISSQAKAVLPNAGAGQALLMQIPVFLSLTASILSGLTAFLNLSDLASRHRNAAESLNALWRDCINWATDFPDPSQCEAAVKRVQHLRHKLNEINRDAPQIPRWAWKSVKKQRNEGSVSYETVASKLASAASMKTDDHEKVVPVTTR